jgi:hypothetical protein
MIDHAVTGNGVAQTGHLRVTAPLAADTTYSKWH